MSAQQAGPSNIQQELLELYANNVSDKELSDVKLLLARYFATRDNNEMTGFSIKAKLDENGPPKWLQEHNGQTRTNRPLL